MASDLDICNSAIVLAGGDENSILSFQDSTREARICAQLYPATRDSLLSEYPWKFTLGQAQLNLLTETPLFDFEYAYQLPTDPKFMRMIKTEFNALNYRIYEDKLYANVKPLKILYQYNPGEGQYPGYFVRALELRLAELLALAMSQDETFSQVLERKAMIALQKAKATDSHDTPNRAIPFASFGLLARRTNG